MDKDDMGSLLNHIEGHVGYAREALASGDPPNLLAHRLLAQAVEIEGWAATIREEAEKAIKGQR